jgi:hypothetical protein
MANSRQAILRHPELLLDTAAVRRSLRRSSGTRPGSSGVPLGNTAARRGNTAARRVSSRRRVTVRHLLHQGSIRVIRTARPTRQSMGLPISEFSPLGAWAA